MSEGLLPLGSVVLLDGGTDRLIIVARLVMDNENRTYDYVGVPYPTGFAGVDSLYAFDDEAIQLVYGLGYQDTEDFVSRRRFLS